MRKLRRLFLLESERKQNPFTPDKYRPCDWSPKGDAAVKFQAQLISGQSGYFATTNATNQLADVGS